MTAIEFLGHVFEFFLPALGTAIISTLMVKCFWWQTFVGMRLVRLLGVTILSNTLALGLGWVLSGHDGTLLAYAIMVLFNALTLWLFALRST